MKRQFTLRAPGQHFTFMADNYDHALEMVEGWLAEDCTSHEFNEKGKCINCDFECDHEWKETLESGNGKFCVDCQKEFTDSDAREAYWMDRGMDERRETA